jgi:hypothetical protein
LTIAVIGMVVRRVGFHRVEAEVRADRRLGRIVQTDSLPVRGHVDVLLALSDHSFRDRCG